jgi:YidC/Oxa1 family membrane protein insertase
VFQAAAWLISFFYSLINNYAFAIAMVAVAVMVIITPLTLKSTKGMLEMQRLQPEMRRLQQQHRGDRQKLNEEMMKLYQEHKVNPLASCLPLLVQMPVFIVMFRVLIKLTEKDPVTGFFTPSYISQDSALYQSLSTSSEMRAFGLDLARRPMEVLGEDFVRGLPYVLLVAVLAVLYYVQQKMVASRTVSPTMSPTQQKIMQYLPVAFSVFQLFFPAGLAVYYITQAMVRIGQQAYITRRFYHGEHSIGRQAQQASVRAREMADEDGGGGGLFGLGGGTKGTKGAKPTAKSVPANKPAPKVTPPSAGAPGTSKRTTPPKGKPTPTNRPNRPAPSGKSRHPKPNRSRP